MQDRPMGFHVTEFEKFTDKASNFTLQLTFKETVSFIFLWYSSKPILKVYKNIPPLSKYTDESGFSSYTFNPNNILQHTREADRKLSH